ncbi:hypothetical protein NSA53_04205 [Cellulosimicrobium cellulans]|uniref:hypothetical protein n=1 Tax=Cellulosimicrobium cellulans TaxID=1710 RepID=UPI002149FFA8|nr:hypothetical protein [Cellulosimicrobium cellulans]
MHDERAVRNICAHPGGIGDLRLAEVTTAILEAWMLDQIEQSLGQAAQIRVALRGAFRSAVHLGYINTDLMAGVSAVDRNDPRSLALEPEELFRDSSSGRTGRCRSMRACSPGCR